MPMSMSSSARIWSEAVGGSTRLGPLEREDSRAAGCIRARLPAHSTNKRQLDSRSNREEVWRIDLQSHRSSGLTAAANVGEGK
jgi:hypothetical protein